jgi:hypothetical protein
MKSVPFYLIILFLIAEFFFTTGNAKATILAEQHDTNASFTLPKNDYVYGNLNIWTNNTTATTTIYAVFIRANLPVGKTAIQVFERDENSNFVRYFGGGGLFDCTNKSGAQPTGIEETLKCVCNGYDTPYTECAVPPSHSLDLVPEYQTGNYIDYYYGWTETFRGIDTRVLQFGQEYVKGTGFLNDALIVYPNPEFWHLAYFLCDNNATSSACVSKEFTEVPPNVISAPTATSSACVNLKPESIFDVVNGVQYALCNISQWLFVPSSVSVEKFTGLKTTFEQKAPFAYFYAIKDAFTNLSPTSTPAFVIGSSTGAIGTNIFQPLKTGLAWVLWFMFGIFVIKRIAKFEF